MIRDTADQDVIIQPKQSTRAWVKWTIASIALIAMLAYIYPSLAQWNNADIYVDQARVRIAAVEKGEFVRDMNLQGKIIAANSPKLYAPAPGNVRLLVNPGDSIEKGQQVAIIDSPQLRNQLEQQQATLASLSISLERKKIEAKQSQMQSRQLAALEKVQLEASEREMRRATKALQIQAISQLDFEEATDDLKRAKLKYQFSVEQAGLEKEKLAFELKTLEFELNQYNLVVENTQRLERELEIVAPVSGMVGSWSVEQQSAVATNQALLTIIDLTAFQVEIDIPESYTDDMSIGMSGLISYNGQDYQAKVSTISPEVQNNIVKGRLIFSTDHPPGIKQNQRVSSRIILSQKNDTLYLPRGSFINHHSGRKVFVVKDGVATLQDVELGSSSINKIEIVNGLTAGENVIVSNTDFVQDADTLILN